VTEKPDLPERNVALLQETMAKIELNPELHDQSVWANVCGTAFCYAGHAAILAGAEVPRGKAIADGHWWCVNPETLESTGKTSMELRGDDVQVDVFAARKLGLTEAEAGWLFDATRTRVELRLLVDALCAGAWIDVKDSIFINGERYGFVDVWLDETKEALTRC